MAAEPVEVPTPFATPAVLPPAKERKRIQLVRNLSSALDHGNRRLVLAPVVPSDLVRRIADSFLVTNDIDHYMDLRAACRSWRSATDDPKNASWDPRFRPRRWIILDEVFQGGAGDTRILVNTATGRVLHKELPLLRDYHVVATTLGGFFVLADRSPPHAARVLNPFTGDMVRFAAPVPPETVRSTRCSQG